MLIIDIAREAVGLYGPELGPYLGTPPEGTTWAKLLRQPYTYRVDSDGKVCTTGVSTCALFVCGCAELAANEFPYFPWSGQPYKPGSILTNLWKWAVKHRRLYSGGLPEVGSILYLPSHGGHVAIVTGATLRDNGRLDVSTIDAGQVDEDTGLQTVREVSRLDVKHWYWIRLD